MRNLRIVLVLALCASGRGAFKNEERILGGWDTTIEKYPFTANMEYGWLGSLYDQACGGALVNSHAIVTAAHCVGSDDPPFWWRARLGSALSYTGGSVHYANRIILHPELNAATLENDIAIVILLQGPELSSSIAPVKIAGRNYWLPENTPVTILGWGNLGHHAMSSLVLQEVEALTVNQDKCAQNYQYLYSQPEFESRIRVTDKMICVGDMDEGGKDACSRDSGGPIVHGDVLIGVISWGHECGHAKYPGVSTKVSAYTDWIVEQASSIQ